MKNKSDEKIEKLLQDFGKRLVAATLNFILELSEEVKTPATGAPITKVTSLIQGVRTPRKGRGAKKSPLVKTKGTMLATITRNNGRFLLKHTGSGVLIASRSRRRDLVRVANKLGLHLPSDE